MITIFCGEKGSGKTKNLINLANEKSLISKGNLVYIDDDDNPSYEIKNKIRFISTEGLNFKNYENFYGFLCGILCYDYDIEYVFIDGLCNIIEDNIRNAVHLFYDLENLSAKHNINFFINISRAEEDMPKFMRKYIA